MPNTQCRLAMRPADPVLPNKTERGQKEPQRGAEMGGGSASLVQGGSASLFSALGRGEELLLCWGEGGGRSPSVIGVSSLIHLMGKVSYMRGKQEVKVTVVGRLIQAPRP